MNFEITNTKPGQSSEILVKEGYKQTKLGWIPEEWNIIKLGKCTAGKGRYGINAPATNYSEDLPTYLRITDIDDRGNFSKEDIVSVNDNNYKDYLLEEGDIVFARTGNTTGKSYLYDPKDGELVFAGFLIKFKPNPNVLISKYLKYYTETNKYWYWVKVMSARSGQPGINSSEYSKMEFPLPPLPEQKKIIDILSTWDHAIETMEQLITKKEELKKGLMQQLLTSKKRFPEFDGKWQEVHFEDVVKIDAESLNSKTPPDYEFQYISLSDVENGQISKDLEDHKFEDAPSRAKRMVTEGDILMATVRPNLQAFALAKKEHQDMIASTGFAVLTPKKDFNIKYLYHYLYSHHMSSQFYALTVGSNYPAINSSDVKRLKFSIPTDNEEINKIESTLTKIDKEIKSLTKNKELMMIQKKGLMQQLLTGKTRVK